MSTKSTTDRTRDVHENGGAPVNVGHLRRARRERILSWVMPIALLLAAICLWEFLVRHHEIPKYLIPAPSLIAETLVRDFASLMESSWFTVKLTFLSLALAIVGGVLLGALFALSRPVGTEPLPVCRDPSGHARGGDSPAHPDLC